MQSTPHITRVLAVPAVGAHYVQDMAALQPGPARLAEVVSVGVVLDTGQVAWGDCVAAAHGDRAGRDQAWSAEEGLAAIRRVVGPALEGRPLAGFRQLAAHVDTLTETVEEIRPIVPMERSAAPPSRRDLLTAPARLWRAAQSDGETATERVTVERRLHTAVRYGVSQALLAAVALARGLTRAEVIAAEWGLPVPEAPVPIHAQPGGERAHAVDKMIARRVPSLRYALIDPTQAADPHHIADRLGREGDKLVQTTRWLKERIRQMGGDAYRPTIYLDLHGALGQIFDNNLGRILGQLHALELAAQPYPLRVASPLIRDSREAQIEAIKTLHDYVRFRHMQVQLVAGEWADSLDDIRAFVEARAADLIRVKMPGVGGVHDSVEAVLACRAAGAGVLLGGSHAETDLSARAAIHVALATRPDLIASRPGMGVDEAISLIQNEMARTLAWIRARREENL